MTKEQFIERYGIEAYQEHLRKQREYQKKWRKEHNGYWKEYEKSDKRKAYIKEYRKTDKYKEYKKEHQKKYQNTDKYKDYKKEYNREYHRNTPKVRAKHQLTLYLQRDKKYNRHFTAPPITYKWIIGRIYTSTCFYCGETDWKKLGCDRIDNSLPHQIDNCIPCCAACNRKRGTKDIMEFYQEMHQPGLFGNVEESA